MPVEPPIETPRSLADAYAVLAGSTAGAMITPIAGGTDLMVRISGEIGEPPERMVDLWRLDELRGISSRDGVISIGALATYTEIRRSGVCRRHLPALVEAAATIGAGQIQNRGTLGGNIANASPAGDTLPVLLALDAEFVCGSARGERSVPASEFWVAYRRTALAPDELIVRVRIPIVAGRQSRFRKVGTRRAQAISKVVIALSWRGPETTVTGDPGDPDHRGDPGGPWSDVRLALGSVADRPIRARATEAVLEGAPPTAETAAAAADALAAEIQPIDDVRSTADYRRAVAARVLHRLVREVGGW